MESSGDVCPYGCAYCYANANKMVARQAFERHDPSSAFLGYSKAQVRSMVGRTAESMLAGEAEHKLLHDDLSLGLAGFDGVVDGSQLLDVLAQLFQ